ncbi:MAG: hypothetical protein ACO397_05940, partial [Gammaproteobacteria bacterium]
GSGGGSGGGTGLFRSRSRQILGFLSAFNNSMSKIDLGFLKGWGSVLTANKGVVNSLKTLVGTLGKTLINSAGLIFKLAVNIPKTIAGAVAVVKGNVAAIGKVSESVLSIFKSFGKLVSDLLKGVLTAAVQIGKTVVSTITTVVKTMFSTIKAVTKIVVAGVIFAPIVASIIAVVVAIKRLTTAFKAEGDQAEKAAAIKKRFVDGLKALRDVLVAIIKPFADATNALFGLDYTSAGKSFDTAGSSFAKLGALVTVGIEKITSALNRLKDSEAFKSFVQKATSAFIQFFNIVKAVFSAVKATISGDSEEASSKFREVVDRIKIYVGSLVQLLAPIWRGMLNKMIQSFINFAKQAIDIASKLIEVLANYLGPPLVEQFSKAIAKIIEFLFSLPQHIPKVLLTLIELFLKFNNKLPVMILQAVVNIVLTFARLIPAIAKILIKVLDLFVEFGSRATGILGSILKTVAPDFIDGVIDSGVAAVNTGLSTATDFLEDMAAGLDVVDGPFGAYITEITGFVNDAFGAVYDAVDSGVETILESDFVKDLEQELSDVILEKTSGWGQSLTDLINDGLLGEDGKGGLAEWFRSLDIPEFKGSELESKVDEFIEDGIVWINENFDGLIERVNEEKQKLKDSFKDKYGVEFDAVPFRVNSKTKQDALELARDIGYAYAQAIEAGGESLDDVAEAAGNAVKDALLDGMQKFIDLVIDYLGNEIDKLKTDLVDKLNDQKEASLKIFDDQLEALDALEKAEEELFKTQERIEEDRQRMRDRALQQENYRRNRALAIYEGRIDDARMLDLEQKKVDSDNAFEDAKTARERAREEQQAQRDILREIIESQRRDAEESFNLIIENFQDFIEEIGRHGTYNQEELEQQFREIIQSAEGASTDMLEAFEDYYTSIPDLINRYTNPTIGFFENPLNQLVESAQDIFGLSSDSPSPDTILGATAAMVSRLGNYFSSSDGEFQGIPAQFESVFENVKSDILKPTIDEMNEIIDGFNPDEVFAAALANANLTIQREYAKILGSTNSLVDQIADGMDEFTRNLITSMADVSGAANAAADSIGGVGTAISDLIDTGDTGYLTQARKDVFTSYFDRSGAYSAFGGSPNAVDGYTRILKNNVYDILTRLRDTNTAAENRRIIEESIASIPPGAMRNALRKYFDYVYYQVGLFGGTGGNYLYNGGQVKAYGYGGMAKKYMSGGFMVPGFGSTAVPAILHGGEFVLNKKAVEQSGLGLRMFEQLNKARFGNGKYRMPNANDIRFNNPSRNMNTGVVNNYNTTNTTNIYVENFIGEDQWFQSMLKEYNIKHKPLSDKRMGNENRFYSTYKGGI